MTPGPPRTWTRWIDLPLLAASFGALAIATWGAWPDVLVDFGRELYAAWRISEGDVLYRDVASFYGPLSPYANGLLFRVCGVGLRTLVAANLAILAATTLLLRALLRSAGTGHAATAAACGAFLAVFGFGHLIANGSFNFVCPYAHEATHGFALSLAAVLCAVRWADPRTVHAPAWLAAAGAACGMSFLTKPEPFVAAAGACMLLVLLSRRRRRARSFAVFAGGLALPPLAACLLLSMALPADEAWRGTLGSWSFAGIPELRAIGYFGWSAGVDHPGRHLAALARATVEQALVLGIAIALAFALRGRDRAARWAALGCAAGLAAVLAPHWGSREWLRAARPLPLWAAGLLAASAVALRRAADEGAARTLLARAGLAALALLFLPRILLNARFFHYGFVLAAAATSLVVAAVLDWIPRALERRAAAGVVVRAVAAVAVAFATASALADSRAFVARKAVAVGSGPDAFRADARGAFVNAAIENVRRASLEGPLVVLPEGVMINYLLRRPSSIPYTTMLPTDDALFGEDEMAASLRRNPPALIGLVHRTTDEFGAPLFGRDYARRTREWIDARYAPAFTVGDPPLEPGSAFGVQVLMRRAGMGVP
jgi:hypothetical protein